MVMMVVCVLAGIAVPAFFIFLVKKRSSKIEAGLSGAIGYGFLGYIWQYLFLTVLTVFAIRLPVPGSEAFRVIVINFLLTFVSTGCVALSLYWGIYLTNQKQLSLYRSAAVGIGFSLGKIGIDLVYSYLYKLYLAIQISNGAEVDEMVLQFMGGTTVGALVLGTYKCLLMLVIVFATALIMGNYYIQKNRKMAWISVFVIYEAVMLAGFLVRYLTGGGELWYNVAFIVVFTAIAAAGGLVLYHWLRTGEVENDPRVCLRACRNRQAEQ